MHAPLLLPVVVFLGGADCPHESYMWLGRRLANKGCCVVLSSCVVNIGNGRTCLLSVPFDMTSLASIEAYTGKCPSHDGLTAILDDVRSVNGDVVEGGGTGRELRRRSITGQA
jgi:hypothetical protein